MEVDLWLARADMVNLCQSQAWYSTASWSSAINTSICEQQIHQYNNQNKGFMVVSLMLPFLHHPSQFSYWVQCSLKNTFAIEKPRIEHSTFFYCVYISVQEDCGSDRETCQNYVKSDSDFKEFWISSTVFVQCPEPWKADCEVTPVSTVPIKK